jgi:hypothetical protein
MVPWDEVPCSMAQSKLIEIPYVLYFTISLALGSLKVGSICEGTLIPMSYTKALVLMAKNGSFFCCNASVMPTVPPYTRREV